MGFRITPAAKGRGKLLCVSIRVVAGLAAALDEIIAMEQLW